jgi:Flp pilus assembly pilin Flp
VFYKFISDDHGQGITEYGAVLALVAILVAISFSLTNGSLTSGIVDAFSSVVAQLNNLSSQSGG